MWLVISTKEIGPLSYLTNFIKGLIAKVKNSDTCKGTYIKFRGSLFSKQLSRGKKKRKSNTTYTPKNLDRYKFFGPSIKRLIFHTSVYQSFFFSILKTQWKCSHPWLGVRFITYF